MKYFFISILIVVAACNNAKDDQQIEGVYAGHFEHEYGINDDTLIFRKANEQNIFELTRKTGTIRKLDGKVFPKEWRTENWNLDYNPEKQTFFELRHGKTLIWNKAASIMQLGKTKYKKIDGL